MEIKVKRLCKEAHIPTRGSNYAAGSDLYALLDAPISIDPGQSAFVKTGLALEIPNGFAGLIYARSGLACKEGLAPANKVGVIDSDYRGEIIVCLHNHSEEAKTISDGQRIAQLVITPVITPVFCEADELCQSLRGDGGFGSTGKK